MPHAVSQEDTTADEDQRLIAQLLNPEHGEELDIFGRDLEPGEKADDAQDFEDIADDDLAEDEDGTQVAGVGESGQTNGHDYGNGLAAEGINGEDGDLDMDDLFGGDPSSPAQAPAVQEPFGEDDDFNEEDLFGPASPTLEPNGTSVSATQPDTSQAKEKDQTPPDLDSFDAAEDADADKTAEEDAVEEDNPEELALWRLQQEMFSQHRNRVTGQHADIPAPPETDMELFRMIFPMFDERKPVRWRKVLPQKRGYYVGKQPLKQPKPIQPTKVSLELMQDQEKLFRLPYSAVGPPKLSRQEEAAQKGLVLISDTEKNDQNEAESDSDESDDGESIGGFKWQDLDIVCADWDMSSESETEYGNIELPPTKKQKLEPTPGGLLHRFYDDFPSLDDPEAATAQLSKQVTLDMNDPMLMLDVLDPNVVPKQPRKAGLDFKRDVSGSFSRALHKRFNISNDDAYDALKENHQQNKVRNLIGNENLEHATPALRLQYPFYKVKMTPRECRSFHRPSAIFKPGELAKVTKTRRVKRKLLKGLSAKEVYATSANLTLGDNSDMLLFEYSEEQPMMLSNFGMHNRLINYYRRKDDADSARPKRDLGETSVLLPKDQGPFSIFGTVEPGEIVPTLTNQMFRAPVFPHEPKKTDFLVIRNTTGENGHSWHIRNIDNLMVVGQQFPSMEVPGTHSRKVTEAAKNRLKMIAYRIYRNNTRRNVRGAKLSNDMIRDHLPGTDIAQNRGKLREFMSYDKEKGSWNPNPNDYSDDMPVESLRKILPETICILDSTQVGNQYLQDSGYNKIESDQEDADAEGGTLEEQMAPWQLTKNFMNACQGKAMLQIHGEGDPSGRDEAFSFIKTSMKGGFRAIGESIEDKLDAKKIKENGGHSYNVARQQKKYEDSIRKVWGAQKQSLSSTIEQEGTDQDGVENMEDLPDNGREPTPYRPGGSQYGTPMHHDDESMSQFSRLSRSSQKGKVLKITRKTQNAYGDMEEHVEIIKDQRVIREYLKRRNTEHMEDLKKDLFSLKPTGDPDKDAQRQRALVEELARLERNQERRVGREKAKGTYQPNNGPDSPSTGKPVGTQRKCKRCGQVGHISTNKKLCPMQNGTIKGPEESNEAFPMPTI